MKKTLLLALSLLFSGLALKSQVTLYSNTFSTSLGTSTALNSSSGAWVWSNSCAQSSASGHSAPGHAMFQGSGCQFGNGGNTVSGSLRTPTIAIGALGGTLTFNYFVANECGSGSCTYDVLSFGISNNNSSSFTTIMSSNTNPGGLANTSGWTSVSYNLSSYTNQTIVVQFDFNSVDGIGNAYDGIYVDDILVTGACTVNIVPTSNSATVAPALCSGNSLTLTTSAISNYSWSTGSTAASIVVSPTVTSSYTLTATSPQACTASTVVTINVSGSTPVLSVTSTTNNVCLGKALILTASGANSYTWTGGVTNGVPFTPAASTVYTVTGLNGCGTSTTSASITVAPLQVLTIVSPTIVCSGQTATITVSAAANSYTILPLNSVSSTNTIVVSPIANTIYTLTAGDGTCSGTSTVNLVTKPNPTITVAATASSVCQGDPVTITASGGTSYTWTPGNFSTPSITVTPTSPTAYSVGATNSVGCTAGNQFAVITLPSPTITAISSDYLICAGATVTLTATGANTYNWSSGPSTAIITDSPLSTTVYSVTGTTSGCSNTQTVEVDVFTPAVSITGNTVLCAGGTTTLTGNGATTYTWMPSTVSQFNYITPSSTDIYTLTSTTATGNINCDASTTVQVIVNPNPTITAIASRTAMCKGESVTVTASGASTYSWSTSATTNTIVLTSTLVTTVNLIVTGTNANGCSSTANAQVKVNSCTGIAAYANENLRVLVYPNPASGEFTIESQSSMNVQLLSELGQVLRTINLNETNSYTQKISGLSSGIYFVVGKNNTQNISQKVIVNR